MKQDDTNQNRIKLAMQVSMNTLFGNIVLSIGKLAAGLLANSGALVSDAVHSASDVASTLIVMLGLRLSGKEADHDHPYGHERFECVCSAFLAALLILTGLTIGRHAIDQLVSGAEIPVPGVAALIAAVISIIVKEAMYHYTIWAAKKINSPALKADAWHHRSDALSSIGSFAGVLGARIGFVQMDAIASLIICLFIFKVGYDILKDAMKGMVDSACDPETEQQMAEVIASVEGVVKIDLLQTRMFGSKIYVDVEIAADGQITLNESHQIAEAVHQAVEAHFDHVKHCMVHVNPVEA